MNPKIKIGLYAVLIIAAAIFAGLFYSSYKSAPSASAENNALTKITSEVTNTAPANLNTATNIATNAPAPANTNVATTNLVAEPKIVPPAVITAKQPAQGRSGMIGYLCAFLAVAIFLGLLIARDISEYFGNRSVQFMFNDEGEGIKNPEYEEAEQEWANGHHLEAVRLMRAYLVNNPREQGVALRIAEIYEKDLKNNLAAALEYEEVLKHKLQPERWGWAAIHLCNLYSKMGKTSEAVALLHRIVAEFGQTPAAEKARKRLAMFETVGEEGLDGDLPDSIQGAPPKPAAPEEKPRPASNLPPGFRPKK